MADTYPASEPRGPFPDPTPPDPAAARFPCPKGAKQDSPGQRPGKATGKGILALKGRNNGSGNVLFRPFRAGAGLLPRSQGVALGCLVPAFQAEKAGDRLRPFQFDPTLAQRYRLTSTRRKSLPPENVISRSMQRTTSTGATCQRPAAGRQDRTAALPADARATLTPARNLAAKRSAGRGLRAPGRPWSVRKK